MRRKNRLLLGLAAVLAVYSMGCGTAGQNQAANPPGNQQAGGQAGQGKKLTIAMVTDIGGIHDNSFNQGSWEGLTRAKEKLGIEAKFTESKSAADYTPNLTAFVKSGADLTWGIGFLMADDVSKVATANSNAKMGIIDSDLGGKIPSNVETVLFKENEGSFLMGVLAGKMTKSNKIGFIGGMKVPLIEKFEYGFKAGVKAVNPNAQVTAAYADAFDKPDKGKLLAANLYQSGADVIYHAAGATGDGVFSEAKGRGKGYWVIGVDRDESSLAPNNTLSSMVKRVDNAIYTATQDLQSGKFHGGSTLTLGLKEGGVDYAPTTSNQTPADVIKIMDDYKQKIINNQIKVPATADEFKAYTP